MILRQKLAKLTTQAPRLSKSNWPAQRTVATSPQSDWPQTLNGGLGEFAEHGISNHQQQGKHCRRHWNN